VQAPHRIIGDGGRQPLAHDGEIRKARGGFRIVAGEFLEAFDGEGLEQARILDPALVLVVGLPREIQRPNCTTTETARFCRSPSALSIVNGPPSGPRPPSGNGQILIAGIGRGLYSSASANTSSATGRMLSICCS
jgi:hypothetical protein